MSFLTAWKAELSHRDSIFSRDDDMLSDPQFIAEYDYCLVLNANEERKFVDEKGAMILRKILEKGFELYAFFSLEKTEVYVLIKAPLPILKKYAEKEGIELRLNSDVVKQIAQRGDKEKNVNPIHEIYHDPDICR
jgi:hypothetical protein